MPHGEPAGPHCEPWRTTSNNGKPEANSSFSFENAPTQCPSRPHGEPSEQVDTHWVHCQAPTGTYVNISSGTCGFKIGDAATCEVAAIHLGLSNTAAITVSSDRYPAGCVYASSNHLFFVQRVGDANCGVTDLLGTVYDCICQVLLILLS